MSSSFYHSFLGFLYRQFFLYPSKLPDSVSLAGQAGLVTGSNTGLGYHASLQLLEAGLSHLILAVRNRSKGEAAKKSLLATLSKSKPNTPPPNIEVWDLDLASYDSITAFTSLLKGSGIKLNFAILNAGVVMSTHELNPTTGHETDIQVNWLSTALLTILLLPLLDAQGSTTPRHDNKTQANRPILSIVGSETAGWSKFPEAAIAKKQGTPLLETLDAKGHFDPFNRYWTSKLLQQFFFVELVKRRHDQPQTQSQSGQDTGTILNIVNPGLCADTELARDQGGVMAIAGTVLKKVIGRSVSSGARTLVHGAVSAGAESDGEYLSDNRVAPFAALAVDSGNEARELRERVWEEMVQELRGVQGFEVEMLR